MFLGSLVGECWALLTLHSKSDLFHKPDLEAVLSALFVRAQIRFVGSAHHRDYLSVLVVMVTMSVSVRTLVTWVVPQKSTWMFKEEDSVSSHGSELLHRSRRTQ